MPIAHEEDEIHSASGEPLRVSAHVPEAPRAHALFAHGLKGFKDYGFIPVLAERLARDAGIAVHRFNFSHSGIADNPATFQRPDLFERDTWRLQTRDVLTLMNATRQREPTLPLILIGHSRGGASALLVAAECFEHNLHPPAAVISISAPSSLGRLNDHDRALLLERGWIQQPSARTGQALRVGRAWLQEQLDDPAWHDLPARCASIRCPVLIVHGGADTSVPPNNARVLAHSCPDATLELIEGADHVWNTPDPAPDSAISAPSGSLDALIRVCTVFLNRVR